MQVRVIIFSEPPCPGNCKTHLIPALGTEGASRLAGIMLAHAIEKACEAGIGPVELCMTPSPDGCQSARVYIEEGVVRSAEGQDDVGARMEQAVNDGLQKSQAVLLICSGCPGLNVDHVIGAAKILESIDCVVHPGRYGGYVLLGLTRRAGELLSSIPWGSEKMVAAVLKRLGAMGRATAIGEVLRRIDEPRDLIWLPESWQSYLF